MRILKYALVFCLLWSCGSGDPYKAAEQANAKGQCCCDPTRYPSGQCPYGKYAGNCNYTQQECERLAEPSLRIQCLRNREGQGNWCPAGTVCAITRSRPTCLPICTQIPGDKTGQGDCKDGYVCSNNYGAPSCHKPGK